MANYHFEGPDGKTYVFEGPDTSGLQHSGGTTAPRTDFSSEQVNVPKEVARIAVQTPLEALGKANQGLRALGVGAQHLIQGDQNALERSAAAAKPGFVPQPGERIGTVVGTTLPMLAAGNIPAAMTLAGGIGAGEHLNEGKGLKEAAIKGATDAAITGAVGLAGNVVGATLKGAYRGAVGLVKGVGRKVVDTVFDAAENSPKTVQDAGASFFENLTKLSERSKKAVAAAEALPDRPTHSFFEAASKLPDTPSYRFSDAAEKLPEGSPNLKETVDSAVSFAQNLQDDAFKSSQKAQELLTGDTPAAPLIERLGGLRKELFRKRLQGAPETTKVEKIYAQWESILKENTDFSGKISQENLKRALRSLDDAAEGAEAADSLDEAAFRRLRGAIDEHLKALNPDYKSAMGPVAKKFSTLRDLTNSFGLKKARGGILFPTDKTGSTIESLAKGSKIASQDAIDASGFQGVKKFTSEKAASLAKEEALKTAQNLDKEAIAYKTTQKTKALTKASSLDRQGEQAFTSAKNQAIRAAERSAPKDVSLGDLRALSESAAKAGKGSPEHQKLSETIEAVLPGRGVAIADDLISGASHELFARGRASGVTLGAANELSKAFKVAPQSVEHLFSFVGKARPVARAMASPLVRAMTEKRKEK